MRDAGRIAGWTIALLVAAALNLPVSEAAAKPRAIAVLPFDTSTLERDRAMDRRGGRRGHQRWVLPSTRRSSRWTSARARRSAERVERGRRHAGGPRAPCGRRGVRSDRASPAPIWSIQPRLLEVKAAGVDVVALEPITVPEGELLARLVPLPATYARTMKVTLTDAETRRIEKAAQPTRLLKAFELYARAQEAVNTAAGPGGQRAGGGSAGARDRGRPQLRASPSTRWGASTRRSATAGRRRRSSGPRPSSTRPIRSPTRRWATCSWPRPAGSSTRRSRPTRRRSTCARSTPTPTWASATPRRPRVTWTAPSAPTRRLWRPIR